MSDAINILRFPLMILVVIVHTNLNTEYDTDGTFYNDFFRWFKYVMYSTVPAFYVISGYLFFRKKEFSLHFYQTSLRKRFYSLLLPYMLWNTLFIGIYYVGGIVRPDLCGSFVRPIADMNVFDLLSCYWNVHDDAFHPAPVDYPLYFVFCLMVCCLLSPVFYFFINALKRYSILLLPLLTILPLHTDFIAAFFFFYVGSYIALMDIDISHHSHKYLLYVLSLFILSCVAIEVLCIDNIFVYYACNLLCTVSMFGIAAHICNKYNPHVPNIIASSLFFIYAYHLVATRLLIKLLRNVVPDDNSIALFAIQIGITTVCFLIGIAAYSVLPRPLRNLLAGNR